MIEPDELPVALDDVELVERDAEAVEQREQREDEQVAERRAEQHERLPLGEPVAARVDLRPAAIEARSIAADADRSTIERPVRPGEPPRWRIATHASWVLGARFLGGLRSGEREVELAGGLADELEVLRDQGGLEDLGALGGLAGDREVRERLDESGASNVELRFGSVLYVSTWYCSNSCDVR